MILLFLWLLLSRSTTEAANSNVPFDPEENQITQIPLQRLPPIFPTPSNNSYTQLQKRNQELTREVIALRLYQEWSYILQKRLDNSQQYLAAAGAKIQALESQIKECSNRMERLTREMAASANQLQEIQRLNDQAREKQQENEETLHRKDLQLQDTLKKINRLAADLQTAQAALAATQEQLGMAQEETRKSTERCAWLNDQVKSQTKRNSALDTQLNQLYQQQDTLKRDKQAVENNLEDTTKQLNSMRINYEKLGKETKETETQLRSTLNEKEASLAQWQKDYTLLKSQLDTALSINRELQAQNGRLQEKSKNLQN